MLWTIIHRAVDIVLLILALSLLSMVGISATEKTGKTDFIKRIELFQKETRAEISKNTQYLESKINSVAERQDGYQNSTFSRLTLLENKLKVIESENKELKRTNKSPNILIQNTQNNNK